MRVAFSTLGRISIENMQRVLNEVVTLRQQIATGRKFEIPSQDPLGAQRSVDLSNELLAIEGYKDAANSGLMFIESAESVLFDIGDQLREVKSIGLSQVNATADSGSREATAVAVKSIRDQLVTLMNTEMRGRYLFAGHRTTIKPFAVGASGGVEYSGDRGEIVFRVGPNQFEVTNVPGSDIVGTTDSSLRSSLNWTPNVTGTTTLAALNRSSGISAGQFQIDDGIGGTMTVDTTALVTVQDLVNQINAGGIGVTAAINPAQNGIELVATNPGDTITVAELNNGSTASQLGLLGSSTGTHTGADIDPAVESGTLLSDIPAFTSLPLGNIRVFQETTTTTVDFGSPPPAATVADVMTRFNLTVPGLAMIIASDGTSLEINGTGSFRIETFGSDLTASQMGIEGVGRQARLFGSLEDMEQALLTNDRDGIEDAIYELERVMTNVIRVQGIVASRARRVDIGLTLLDTYQLTAETRLGDVQSTEMAETVSKLTEAQTLYQTALGTAASVFDLNLFKYIYR